MTLIILFSFDLIFYSHILLCNILTTILKPNFEEPLDTAKQLVEQNIVLYDIPGSQIIKQSLLESSIPEYNILGQNFIVADNWDNYYNLREAFKKKTQNSLENLEMTQNFGGFFKAPKNT